MIKILHVLSSNSLSGAEKVAIEIIRNLSPEYRGIYCSADGKIKKSLNENNIEHFLLDELNLSDLNGLIREINPHLIHAHDFKASVKIALLNPKAKIISHLHHNPPWISRLNYKTISYTCAARRISKILLVSESIKTEFKTTKKIKAKMYNVKNPVDTIKINLKADENIPVENFDIVFVGRLTEAKSVEFLIEIYSGIIKRLPQVKIGIIGNGNKLEVMNKLVDEDNISENVKFIGYKENPFPYLKASKIMIMPSKWEGFGLAAAEAMALGIPVLATPVGGLENVVGYANDLICKSKESFVEKAVLLLTDEGLYKEISINVKNKIISEYRLKDYIEKIEQTYKSVLTYNRR